VTVPQYFLLPLRAMPSTLSGVHVLREDNGQDPVLPLRPYADDPSFPNYPPPRAVLTAGGTSDWFLGETLHPSSATLLFSGPATSAVVRFGLTGAGGGTTWGPAARINPGTSEVTGALPDVSALGLRVQVLSGDIPSFQGAVTVDGRPYELRGSLAAALKPGAWRDEGVVQGFTMFVRQRKPTPIYAVVGENRPVLPVQMLSNVVKTETVRVRARTSITVVRDVAWDPGWEGTVSVNGGRARQVAVIRRGLVQEIHAPAGDDVVTFRYRPPHLVVGSVLSGGAVLVLLALGVGTLVRWRRRKPADAARGHGTLPPGAAPPVPQEGGVAR
jgi:hypothetical protein